jgi:nicotinic acid mononucleotide adenylyltransferase
VEDPVSATDLRRRLAAGEPVGDLLPEPVAEYIRARRLYESVGGAEELP